MGDGKRERDGGVQCGGVGSKRKAVQDETSVGGTGDESKRSVLQRGESNPGLPRDRQEYWPLYYVGLLCSKYDVFDELNRVNSDHDCTVNECHLHMLGCYI